MPLCGKPMEPTNEISLPSTLPPPSPQVPVLLVWGDGDWEWDSLVDIDSQYKEGVRRESLWFPLRERGREGHGPPYARSVKYKDSHSGKN